MHPARRAGPTVAWAVAAWAASAASGHAAEPPPLGPGEEEEVIFDDTAKFRKGAPPDRPAPPKREPPPPPPKVVVEPPPEQAPALPALPEDAGLPWLFVYVYPADDVDPVVTANITAGLTSGVDRKRYRVVDLGLLVAEQERASEELADADRTVTRALAQLQQLEIEAADGALDAAIAAYEQHLVTLLGRDGGLTKLAEAHAAKAVARFLDGDDDNAIRALRRAFVCDVEVASSKLFPPDMGPVVARERTRFEELGTGKLEVVTPGVAAQVLVDGAEVGTSPARFDALAVGTHYVTLSAPNQPTLTISVAVEPGETTTLEQALPTYPGDPVGKVREARGEVGAARPGAKLRAAATAVGSPDRMLLATTRTVKGGVEVTTYLYDLETGTLGGKNTRVVPADEPHDATEALARSMMSIAPRVAAVGHDGPPIWKRRWFWPAVGIASAVVVGTIIVLAATDGMSTGQQIIFLGVGF